MILMHEIDYRPADAWERILALVEHASSGEALSWIGEGPLEDLLAAHGSEFVEIVVTTARNESRFANCLSHVWGWNRFEPGVYQQVQEAVRLATGKNI